MKKSILTTLMLTAFLSVNAQQKTIAKKTTVILSDTAVYRLDNVVQRAIERIDSKAMSNELLQALQPIYKAVSEQATIIDTSKKKGGKR